MVEKENPNPRELHKVFLFEILDLPTKERDLAAIFVCLWVLYQAKSLAPTIEDLIGVFM